MPLYGVTKAQVTAAGALVPEVAIGDDAASLVLAVATLKSNNAQLRVSPIFLPAGTYDRVTAEITTVGSANSVLRLGLYAMSNGLPGALVSDFGTINGTSQTIQSITISLTLRAGFYWAGGVNQGSPVTDSTFRAVGGSIALASQLTASPANAAGAYFSNASVTAGLPDPFGAVGGITTSAARLSFRRSA